MQRFFSILADAVTSFEGTVDKFTGDGIMAVFGAPIAHEDHAQRACYAALQMLDDVSGYAAELRRGAGPQLLDPDRDQLRRGGRRRDRPGRRRRLHGDRPHGRAGAADGGAGRAGQGLPDRAHRRARRRLPRPRGPRRVRDQGRQPAGPRLRAGRGRRGALRASTSRASAASPASSAAPRRWARWRRRSSGPRPATAASSGWSPTRESARAGSATSSPSAAARTASRSSRPRRRPTGRRSPSCRCCRCCAPSSGSASASPSSCAREKIAGRALLLDPGFADDLPLMFDFLGVPDPDRPVPQMSPEARQRALGGIVCRLVNAPSRRKTLVLVIEDLHWIDEGSNAMLADLVESIEGTNTLAVVNFRPEYSPPWAGSPAYRAISLAPLARADTARAAARPGRRGPLARRPRRADPRAHPGQPVLHRGDRPRAGRGRPPRGRARRLPAGAADRGRRACRSTVQAILAARIDRLDPDAKQLLQVASVVGKEISGRALGLTAGLEPEQIDRALCELIEAGFLYEAEIYPQRVLAFRHPLTREVAYGTQLADGGRRPTRRRRGRRSSSSPTASTSWPGWSPTTWRRAARRWKRRAGTPAPPTGPATASRATRCASGSG